MSQALGLLAVALLVAASAYFVAMEFSFTAANRNRLTAAADEGDRKAQAGLRVLKRLSFCLSGAQLGITFAALLTGFVAEPVFAAVFEPGLALIGVPEGARVAVSLTLGFIVSTFALMVLGELAPKNLAIAIPEKVARSLARSTLLYMRVGGPVIKLFDGAANRLLRLLGITPIQEAHGTVSPQDLARMIDSSSSAGHLTPEESRLLGRALDFGELTAADVMVPRPRVVTVDEDANGARLRSLLGASGYSRVPLTRGPAEVVVGIVSVKNLLDLPAQDRASVAVRDLASTAVLRLPQTAPLGRVVAQLRTGRSQIAVVVDEHGADVGILTLEDIVEELVGEIQDEYDQNPSPTATDSTPVLGAWHLHEVSRQTGIRLPDGAYDTLAGLILHRLGRLAAVGDEVRLDAQLDSRAAGAQDGDGSDGASGDDEPSLRNVLVILRVESLAGRTIGEVNVAVAEPQTDAAR